MEKYVIPPIFNAKILGFVYFVSRYLRIIIQTFNQAPNFSWDHTRVWSLSIGGLRCCMWQYGGNIRFSKSFSFTSFYQLMPQWDLFKKVSPSHYTTACHKSFGKESYFWSCAKWLQISQLGSRLYFHWWSKKTLLL